MIRAVLFDLDGTLWDRDKAFRQLVEGQYQTFPQLAAVHRPAFIGRMLELDDHGLGDKRTAYARVVSELGLESDLATLLYDSFLTEYFSFVEPFPEVLATLRWLRNRTIKLGIITNGTIAMQERKIESLGLAPLMDVVLISERESVRKPDRAIFERGLSRLGVDSAASWFVGDHPDADIRGASEAGLTAVWRRSWGQADHATHTITSLDQLIPLLIGNGLGHG